MRVGLPSPLPAGRKTKAPPSLTCSPLPAGPSKLGGEAAHLPHLRPPPESQSSSSPLLQTTPGVKGHQRVVTLAQHISVTTPSLTSSPLNLGWAKVLGKVAAVGGVWVLGGKPSPGGLDPGGRGMARASHIRGSGVSDSDVVAAPHPADGASGAWVYDPCLMYTGRWDLTHPRTATLRPRATTTNLSPRRRCGCCRQIPKHQEPSPVLSLKLSLAVAHTEGSGGMAAA